MASFVSPFDFDSKKKTVHFCSRSSRFLVHFIRYIFFNLMMNITVTLRMIWPANKVSLGWPHWCLLLIFMFFVYLCMQSSRFLLHLIPGTYYKYFKPKGVTVHFIWYNFQIRYSCSYDLFLQYLAIKRIGSGTYAVRRMMSLMLCVSIGAGRAGGWESRSLLQWARCLFWDVLRT